MSRRAWKIAGLGVLGFLAVATVLVAILYPRIGVWAVRTRVLPRLEHKLGRHLEIGRVEVGRGDVVLHDVRVTGEHDAPGAPLARVDRVSVAFDFWRALRGDVRLGAVELQGADVHLYEAADGHDNFRDVIARLREPSGDGDGAARKGGGTRGPTSVRLERAKIALVDDRHGIKVGIEDMSGEAKRHGAARLVLGDVLATHALGPRAAARALEVTADTDDPRATLAVTVSDGSAALWHKMSLTGIRGTIKTGKERGRAEVALEGGWGGAEGTLWRADGWLAPEGKQADLHLRADRFTLDKIEKILVGTPIQHPEKTAISAALDVALKDDLLTFAGTFDLAGLTLAHPYLADDPVGDLGFQASVRGTYAVKPRKLALEELKVAFRGVDARLEAAAELPGGEDAAGARREQAHLAAHLVVPPIDCQAVLDAIPRSLVPRLSGFQLKGTFDTDLHIDIDWANLDALDLGGSVGIFGCKVAKAPDAFAKTKFMGEFDQVVEVEENSFTSFRVGPSNPDYVPLDQVSPYLVSALVSSEDYNFWNHRGFIPREFRTALITNLKAGSFRQGASSITMQTVKNLFLYRQKTLSRKLQELFLTWYLEQILPKQRIFEIYLNVIEFGPGIYGIGQATKQYFGKRPKDLNPVEAVFFSTILPNPKGRYMQYCVGALNRMGDAMLVRKLKLLHDRKFLTDEEYAVAEQTPLVFDRTTALPEAQCREMVLKLLKRTRPSMPTKPKSGG